MKLVLVSQRIDVFKEQKELRDTLDLRLTQFILFSGYLPVPVPNSLNNENLNNLKNNDNFLTWVEELNIKAVILSGGNDIGTSKQRDGTESCLLDYAKNNLLPVLGICRGMQMLGIRGGSKLKTVSGHVATTHKLTGEIAEEVNSYHNKALTHCPKDYYVLAKSNDGEIEAIKHSFLSWEGWMWHPERNNNFKSSDIERLRKLFGK